MTNKISKLPFCESIFCGFTNIINDRQALVDKIGKHRDPDAINKCHGTCTWRIEC